MEFESNISYRRIILVNAILILTIVLLFLFCCYNWYISHYIFAVADALGGLVSVAIFIYLRITKNILFSARMITLMLMLFFIFLTHLTQGAHLGIIWTLLLPLFAIITTGKREGALFSLFFFTIVFAMAYQGLGIWDDGRWNDRDLIRLVSVAIIITFIVYFNEFALERSDKKLQEVRTREQDYIEQLQKLSITDGLTGLYNRRHFDDITPKLLALSKRKKLYFNFFIIDIDHFKSYNDHYGHQAGDQALIAVSGIIKEHIQRDDDFVFRLGGDEFAGIALSKDPKEVQKHVENICQMVETLNIENSYASLHKKLTTSIGMVSVSYENSFTAEELYKAADKNLYLAKEGGKHQCVATIL